jgi:hypothetical protein
MDKTLGYLNFYHKRPGLAGHGCALLLGVVFSSRQPALCAMLFTALVFVHGSLEAAPVPVLYSEGMVRGFLVLSDTRGSRLASGDFLQTSGAGKVTSRTLFHFRDGSVHDETAVFTQQGTFLLVSYRLTQKGPAFSDDMEISLDRSTGKYLVKVRGHKSGREKVLDGRIDLPLDVYNGMVPTVVKNLVKGDKVTIHVVAFTPAPRVIELDMAASGEDAVLVGDLKKRALHYVLKPRLGVMLKLPAALLGRTPPDNHLWIITSEVPAFVRFDGPLATDGPTWRIELASPVWPK